MIRGFPLVLIATVGACAGRALATSGSATSLTPAPDVFTCVRQQIKALGFAQESVDEEELRVTGRKYNDKVRRPDVQFRRLIDRIAFDVGPAESGDSDTAASGTAASATAVSAQASTFAELSTHRGPTEQQERTSETAKEAARAILARCTASTSKS